jgi:hypothetical protein
VLMRFIVISAKTVGHFSEFYCLLLLSFSIGRRFFNENFLAQIWAILTSYKLSFKNRPANYSKL